MRGIENSIVLGVGNISLEKQLGLYYQDTTPAVVHINKGIFAALDKDGIPFINHNNRSYYAPITVIQYAIMQYDFYTRGVNPDEAKKIFLNCVNWLENKSEPFKDTIIIRHEYYEQYDIAEGWVSGMVQGQLISVFLRAYQLEDKEKYLDISHKVFNSFYLEYEEGGFKRIDENGCLWFEEYPTATPSYVLNGFIYAMFGILDYYRVTGNIEAKNMWDSCVVTLERNLYKYDVWYWSMYDQLKKQLVSYYYQKNVHIPLMKIMHQLTGNDMFHRYAVKWQKNLDNNFHYFVTKVMYRVKPRIKKVMIKS